MCVPLVALQTKKLIQIKLTSFKPRQDHSRAETSLMTPVTEEVLMFFVTHRKPIGAKK